MRSTVPSPIRRSCGPTSWSRPDLMPIPVLMPALSPTMTEGKLAKWHVKVGDVVKAGQVLCEIETDKATMEVEAVDEGTVAQILVEEGTEGVAVNTPICILAAEGERVAAARPRAQEPSPCGRQGRGTGRQGGNACRPGSREGRPRGRAGVERQDGAY